MKPEQELHLAVQENDRKKVEELLDNGVDINCLFYAWTPLQHAVNLGKLTNMADVLKFCTPS